MSEMVNMACPNCGIAYLANSVRLKHGRETSCGRKCSYELRAAGLSTSIYINCGMCGIGFSRQPSKFERVKHGDVFCSPAFQYAARSVGITKRIVSIPYKNHSPHNKPNGRRKYAIGWKGIKRKLHAIADGKCQLCSIPPQPGKNLEAHHIIPIRYFPKTEDGNEISNLIILCKSCHVEMEKGATALVELLAS